MPLSDPHPAYGGLPFMIRTSGPDRRCNYVNERWLEFTGRRLEDELGWGWSERVHPEDRNTTVAAYNAGFEERRPFGLEYRMQRADGEYRWVLDTAAPRTAPGGELAGYVFCCADVTDSRALEQRASRIERTAGRVAHDFNNLLTGILGHVTLLLEDESLSPESRQDVLQIQHAAERAAGLTRRLQPFDRPPIPGAEAAAGAGESAPISLGGGRTVLLVEDEEQVRDLGRRILERAGYTVLTAGDAEAAMAAADRFPGHIHLLITDVALPQMGGRELAARLGIHRPAIKVLYVSGTSDEAIARHRLLEPGTEFLEKPFSLNGLLRKVGQVVGAPEAAARQA